MMNPTSVSPAKQDALARAKGSYRLEVLCPVKFLGPLHVGAGERLSLVSDAPVLRDHQGRPYLPQSSVRGVLRDWCEREAPTLGVQHSTIQHLFGATDRFGGSGTTMPADRQGRLTVTDVMLDVAQSEVRDHVKLDRPTGTASYKAKFDQEIVHCNGAEIRLVYEGDGPGDDEVTLLLEAIAALENGLLAFGGKTGWGLGWVTGKHEKSRGPLTTFKAVQRNNIEALSTYLTARCRGDVGASEIGRPVAALRHPFPRKNGPHPWSWLRLDLDLQFDGPMLVAGRDRGSTLSKERAPDALRLETIDGRIVLPGSSFRGALHSHADRVAATLGRTHVANTLFGVVSSRGLLRVGDADPVDRKGSVLHQADVGTVWLDHVAIDRVTGFAAGKKLFNTLALASPRFRVPLMVRWNSDSEASKSRAAVALLLFVLRDAQEGLLWVGSRTTRGYGHLREVDVVRGDVSVARVDGRLVADIPPGTMIGKLAELPDLEPVIKNLVTAWSLVGSVSSKAVP